MRDSAGVRIVDNGTRPAGPEIRVAATPELTIGSQMGSAQFTLHRVSDARSLSDGRLVVVNGRELLWFTPDGKFMARGGGAGDGPHEFREFAGLSVLTGDTIIAIDRLPANAKFFAPDGRFIRALPLASMRSAPMSFGAVTANIWAGLAFGGEKVPARVAEFREDWLVTRHELSGTRADTITLLAGESYYGDLRRSVRLHGSPQALHTARHGRIAAANSGTYEVKLFDEKGRMTHLIRNALPNPPLSSIPEDTLTPGAGRRAEVGGTAPALQLPTAPSAPAFHFIMIASDQSMWLRRNHPLTPAADWHVYDANGVWISSVQLPGRFRLTEITRTGILGVLRDELDVEYVVRYRIMR
jgi:hypothetical protein